MADVARRERLINRRRQGDLGESSAIEWLTRIGANVLIPFGHSPDYDLVADLDGRLLRIQVKTSTMRADTLHRQERWSLHVATNGGNQSWSGVAKRFDPMRVDYLFALVGNGRRWFVPAAAVQATIGISLGGTKYSEFEIDRGRAILDLVYGKEKASVESGFPRGSAGVGEPVRSVKSEPSAEWVRFPPPPSADAPVPSAPTRVSANHQVTIPSVPFRAADLSIGDRLRVAAEGPGRVVLERIKVPDQRSLPILSGEKRGL